MSSDTNKNNPCQQQWPPAGHPSTLPGDPSLILTTNVDLGDKKMEIMKACSKAISAATGKPESYIAVCVNDNASMIFGGSDAPLALGCMYSIGAIAMESNGQVQASVTEQLAPFGVTGDRIYINFFVSLFNLISCFNRNICWLFRFVSCTCNPNYHISWFSPPFICLQIRMCPGLTLAGMAQPSLVD
jgi:phenylpyruvate tautomerase